MIFQVYHGDMMKNDSFYSIHTDIAFKPLELIDVAGFIRSCTEEWFNQTLCRINDSVIRLGVVKGDFHWHVHEREDEFFYVISGRLEIEFKDKSIVLNPGQGFSVPRGVRHRTKATVRTAMLMVEGAEVEPTGD